MTATNTPAATPWCCRARPTGPAPRGSPPAAPCGSVPASSPCCRRRRLFPRTPPSSPRSCSRPATAPTISTTHLVDERLNAIVAGPGLGTGAPTRDLVRVAAEAGRGLVLDADALTSFSAKADRTGGDDRGGRCAGGGDPARGRVRPPVQGRRGGAADGLEARARRPPRRSSAPSWC